MSRWVSAIAGLALCGALLLTPAAAQRSDAQPGLPPSIVNALEKQDYEWAVRALEDFLFNNVGHRAALIQLAFVYGKLDRNAEAIELYGELALLEPNNFSVRINLGVLLMQEEEFEEAVVEFRHAAEGRPDNFRVRFYLATALEQAGKPAEALTHYARAVEINPEDGDARTAIVELIAKQENLVGHAALMDRVLVAAPTDIVLLELRAASLRLEGKGQEVLDLYEKYLVVVNDLPDTSPHDIATIRHRAGLHAHEMKLYKRAILHHQIAGAMGGEPFAWASAVGEAKALGALERYEEAAPLYRRVLELSGHDIDLDIYEEFGFVLFMTKRYADAVKVLADVVRLDPSREASHDQLVFSLHRLDRHEAVIAELDQRARNHAETPGTIFLRAHSQDKLKRCAEAIAGYGRFLEANLGEENNEYFQASGRLRFLKRTCKKSR